MQCCTEGNLCSQTPVSPTRVIRSLPCLEEWAIPFLAHPVLSSIQQLGLTLSSPSAPCPLLPLPISSASSCYSTTLCQPHFLARPVHHFLCPPLPSLRPTFAPSHHPPLTVNGLAVGGHANVALANYFDIVFASSKARFKYPFVKLGLTPELGRYVCVCVCRMD